MGEIAICSVLELGVCLELKALDDVQGWMNDRIILLNLFASLFFWYLT